MREAQQARIKVYCETSVIGDPTSRPSPLVRNLARQLATREWWEASESRCDSHVASERDALEELYEVKRSLSSSFADYRQFADWLMSEQEAARRNGVKFVAA